MSDYRKTQIVLKQIKDHGVEAKIDEDGDIIVQDGNNTIIVQVSDTYIHARMQFLTSAPINALAIVSRKLHQRLLVGRMVYADDGSMFYVDSMRFYGDYPELNDSTIAITTVVNAVDQVVKIAEELGYKL